MQIFVKTLTGKEITIKCTRNLKIEDIKDEIFDIAKPKNQFFITFDDLMKLDILTWSNKLRL